MSIAWKLKRIGGLYEKAAGFSVSIAKLGPESSYCRS